MGLGGVWYQRLNYPAAHIVMDALGIKRKRRGQVLLQLQVLENEGAKILNAKR